MSKNSKCPRKEDLCLNCCFAPFYLVAVCTSHSLPLLLFHFAGNLLFSELHVFRTCGYPFLLSCFCSSTEICIFVFIFILFFFLVTLHRIFLSLYTPFPSVFIIVGTRRQVLSFFCNISNLAISVSLLDIFKIFLLPSQTAV